MITPFDFILAAGAVAFLAVLTLVGVMLPADEGVLTEADLDDEDDIDHMRIDRGEVV